MGRTVLHMEPALRGGPKPPAGWRTARTRRGAPGSGPLGRKARKKVLCDPQPGKTAK